MPTSAQTDGLAKIMLGAVLNVDSELTLKRILYWHKYLFPKGCSNYRAYQYWTA
tara:strand:+ start:5686 stop:5847 length:162 start_codon:yes stop_codon:yes gene_type:complete